MRPPIQLRHEFVNHIPRELTQGVIYISITFATVAHKCCCGCGYEIVTPLAPTDWQLTFDGRTVSLYPSIGNWSLECKSHYWVKQDQAIWAGEWSRRKILAGRVHDQLRKSEHSASVSAWWDESHDDTRPYSASGKEDGFWTRVRRWLLSK